MHKLLKDTVFVRRNEANGYNYKGNQVDFSQNLFKVIRGTEPESLTVPPPILRGLLRKLSDIFQEELTKLPPMRPIEHEVKPQGTTPKSRPLY